MKGVKIVSYRDNLITLEIGGQRFCYFVARPQPLGPMDASMLRDVMDTRMMETLTRTAFELGGSGRGVLPWLVQQIRFLRHLRRSNSDGSIAALIAKRLGEVGVPFEVEGTKCLAILQSDVKKLEKGVI